MARESLVDKKMYLLLETQCVHVLVHHYESKIDLMSTIIFYVYVRRQCINSLSHLVLHTTLDCLAIGQVPYHSDTVWTILPSIVPSAPPSYHNLFCSTLDCSTLSYILPQPHPTLSDPILPQTSSSYTGLFSHPTLSYSLIHPTTSYTGLFIHLTPSYWIGQHQKPLIIRHHDGNLYMQYPIKRHQDTFHNYLFYYLALGSRVQFHLLLQTSRVEKAATFTARGIGGRRRVTPIGHHKKPFR